MPCYGRRTAYRSRNLNPKTGNYPITFSPREGYTELHIKLPCGQCIGCRLEDSRQKAVRCSLEASLYEKNCFLTLTYNDDHLPKHGHIQPDDVRLFMMRLRKKYGAGIRSFGCAEYGEKNGRPHYHILIFNHDFRDKIRHATSPRGDSYYTSEELTRLWSNPDTGRSLGYALIGDLTFESAAYVARYVTKKITGPLADLHYEYIDEHGEILRRPAERPVAVSLKPGIGKPWLDRFKTDVYPSDFLVMRGIKFRPPKYFDRRYEIDNPKEYSKLKLQRAINSRRGCCGYKYCLHEHVDATPSRLLTREQVQLLKFEQLQDYKKL